MDLCKHDMLAESCDWCHPRQPTQPQLPDGTITGKTRCRWPKKCPGCGDNISAGQTIYCLTSADDPESKEWICGQCADEVTET